MTRKEREQLAERRVIHPATYRVRHDNGETFEVQGLTLARVRKLIETECHDRMWIVDDTWAELIEDRQVNRKLAISNKETK